MRITDCVWEIENIGKKTCEVLIEKGDELDEHLLLDLDSQFEYQVVKVDSGLIGNIIYLEDHGFHLIETQIDVEIKINSFDYNDCLVKFLTPDISFEEVDNREKFNEILNRVTPEMFVSDRIALDPSLGVDYSCKRYKTWMKNSFESNNASFFQMKYRDEYVGFSMYRLIDSIWHGDLGGVYPECGKGLGLLTACGPLLYIRKNGITVSKLVSSISSNNIPVISTFNHCHYNFKNFKYVFVKHNDN